MSKEIKKDPLVEVYGEEVLALASTEIEMLKEVSNITFDAEYIKTGVAFMRFKAQEILEGEKKQPSLKSLVRESFGEAAMAIYNR